MSLPVDSRIAPLVRRERLVSALALAVERPLTLVTAPAGYGKTTAVRQFVEQADFRTAWITSEPGGDRFASWHRIASVLHAAGVDPGSTIKLGDPPLGGRSEQDLLLAVLDEMGRTVEPTLVVVDNLDVVRDPVLLQHLAFLVNRLPPLVRLLVVSRAHLALPIGRWRAQGRLAEIGREELRFRPTEAAELLAGLGLVDLSSSEVDRLNQRAEGWPVGLALLADSHRDGSSEELFDEHSAGQLVDDLLGTHPSEIQELVLSTSVLRYVNDEVAREVTGRDDAGRLLQSVESANLFLVPADETGVWFRYERLFGELMRWELQRRDASQPRLLHQRAARWYEAHGLLDDTLHHLVAAGQPDEALAFVATHASLALDEVSRTGTDWWSAFPAEWLEADPARMLSLVIAHGRRGRLDEAYRWLARAEAELTEMPEDDPRQALALTVRALWHGVHFESSMAIELGTVALERLSAQGGDDLLQRLLLISLANSYLLDDDVTAAEHAVDDLAALSPLSTVNELAIPALRARIAGRRGELRQAEALGAAAAHTAGEVTVGSETAFRSGHYALGNVLAERGQLDAAEDAHHRGVRHGLGQGWLAPAVMAELGLAEVRAARDGPGAGLAVLGRARDRLGSLPASCALSSWANLTEARLRIAQRSYDQAESLLERVAPGVERSLTQVRLELDRGDVSRAEDLLRAVPATMLRDRITVHLLAARVAAIAGHASQRDDQLLAAARLAEPEGFRLTWLTEVAGLLPRLRDLVERDSSLFGYVGSIAGLAEELPQALAGAPLSEREVVVLRHLQGEMSAREIASQLNVSINTLKTHLRSLYRKLGVSSRSGAVAAGRQAGLL